MQKTNIWAKILSKELKDFIDRLDSGNTNVPEDGEQAAYLIGYLVQKMHRVFRDLIQRGKF